VNRQENEAYVNKFLPKKLDGSDDFEKEVVGGRTVINVS
jgi:hypothetical protein